MSLTSLHPAKRGRYDEAPKNPRWPSCDVVFPLLEHARKTGVNKNQKRNGGWIMKAKSLLLTILIPITGLTFLSLPAGAECWMTCPPGSTTTEGVTGENGTTATAEPVASPEGLPPAKKPEATAKASPAPAPAKSKAAANPAGSGPATEPSQVQSTSPTPAAAPAQGAVAPPAPTPQPSEDNPAFQPAPAQGAVPAPVPIPGPVPGTATMHVIPE